MGCFVFLFALISPRPSGSATRRALRGAYDATWGRLFAAGYDRALAASEEAGLSERRRELIATASGPTLELGAGTGLNLVHYPEAVGELTLSEPFEPMARQLRERVRESGREAAVIEASAEHLPIADSTFDTVVATLVLCTVDDQATALSEIERVLRPNGRLLFLEHVRSTDPGLARWQDRLERPWRFIGHGCRCNRDTVAAIAGSGLELGEIERGRVPKATAIVKPLAQGSARKAA